MWGNPHSAVGFWPCGRIPMWGNHPGGFGTHHRGFHLNQESQGRAGLPKADAQPRGQGRALIPKGNAWLEDGESWRGLGAVGEELVGSPKGAAWQLQLGATPVRAEADSEGFGGWTSLVGLGAFAPCDHYPRCGDSSTQPNVAPPFGGGQFRRVWGGRFSRSSRQTLSMSLRMMEYWSSRLPTRSTACLWERAAMKMVSPSSV